MKKTFYILSFSLFLTSLALAQDTLQTPYFPFTEGDTLVYSAHEFSGQYIEDSRIVFTKDSLDEQGTRHLLIDYEGFWPIAYKFEVDSLGNIYADNWWSGLWKVFNQSSRKNEPWIAKSLHEGFDLACLLTIEETITFGATDTVKGVEYYYHWEDSTSNEGLQSNYAEWSEKFGVIYKFNYEGGPQHILKGVVKNGVVYGDTTAVFVSREQENEIPKTVHLYQNYPNPFNPSTTITFQLREPQNISLSVYSVTGQLVKVIENNALYESGTHTVQFHSGNLVSGIYLYTLETNERRFTKKMAIIK